MIDPDAPRCIKRLATQDIRLVDHTPSQWVAEGIACRTRSGISAQRLGLPDKDDAADRWWCPNGFNQAE